MPLDFDHPRAPRTLGRGRREVEQEEEYANAPINVNITDRGDIRDGLREVGGKWSFLRGDDWQRRKIDEYVKRYELTPVERANYTWVSTQETEEILSEMTGYTSVRAGRKPQISVYQDHERNAVQVVLIDGREKVSVTLSREELENPSSAVVLMKNHLNMAITQLASERVRRGDL